MSFLDSLLSLLVGHAVADYAWQSEGMVSRKDLTKVQEAAYGPWWWTMLAHSLINGGMVAGITGSWAFGVAETLVHFWADTAKCLGVLTTNEDQLIHVACKFIWAFGASAASLGYGQLFS